MTGRTYGASQEGADMLAGRRVLITGATGILGSYVLAKALDRGYCPVVLMRDRQLPEAAQRLQRVLELTGNRHSVADVQILRGDVREPAYGLDSSEVAVLRSQLDLVIHCAASVTFEPLQRDLLWDTNVCGTRHTIELFQHTGIPLYYVSTAYVAGARPGPVFETELDVGQAFNNHYERSKVYCERLIRDKMAEGALTGCVFRPSIIVGAAANGHIVQFLNFYAFVRLTDAVASGRIDATGDVRFLMRPECTKNIVPVDWTAEALWRILEKEGLEGKTYHLTNPRPPDHREIFAWANQILEGRATFHALGDAWPGPTRVEKIALKQLDTYANYLQAEPAFDRANTESALDNKLPVPETRHAFFNLLLDYARSRNWKKLFVEPQNGSRPGGVAAVGAPREAACMNYRPNNV